MCEPVIGASAVRWMRTQAIEPAAPRENVTADLLTTILLDGKAADRWLARAEADIGEAREAIGRLIASARELAQLLDGAAFSGIVSINVELHGPLAFDDRARAGSFRNPATPSGDLRALCPRAARQ